MITAIVRFKLPATIDAARKPYIGVGSQPTMKGETPGEPARDRRHAASVPAATAAMSSLPLTRPANSATASATGTVTQDACSSDGS